MFAARRETLSIHNEVRFVAWAGVMLIATGAGIVIKKHFDEIGPLTIAVILGLTAAACYAWVAAKKKAPLDDYVVLLGALLISADVAFIERQWHLLDREWQRHFLLLAIVHAVAAYFFDSKAVMSLSVAALAAWLGVERQPHDSVEYATRAFTAAGVIGIWRLANRRPLFNPVFEHFAANLAFWGSIMLAVRRDTQFVGSAIAIALAAAAIAYGFRQRRELFIIYGYVYGLIAVNCLVLQSIDEDVIEVLFLLFSTVAVIIAMIVTHMRLRKA
jgi:hypothetical protein